MNRYIAQVIGLGIGILSSLVLRRTYYNNVRMPLRTEINIFALGLNISYYRKREGMTQKQLAEKAGMSRSYLGEIEAPNVVTTISLEVLFSIADALWIPASKLLAFRDSWVLRAQLPPTAGDRACFA